jgi:hypothetical protein
VALRQFIMNSRMDGCIPGNHFGQVAIATHRRLPWIERPLQISAIDDLQAKLRQLFRQLRYAQGLWTHRRAAMACADIGRYADQRKDSPVHAKKPPDSRIKNAV